MTVRYDGYHITCYLHYPGYEGEVEEMEFNALRERVWKAIEARFPGAEAVVGKRYRHPLDPDKVTVFDRYALAREVDDLVESVLKGDEE